MSNLSEVWRPVVGYEGLYSVSSEGRIRSEPKTHNRWRESRILALDHDQKGYPTIALRLNGTRRKFRVHRLVALAFIPNPLELPQVNHIDGDKEHGSVSNLEWVTAVENMSHAIHVLKVPIPILRGEACHFSKLTEQSVRTIRTLLAEGVKAKQIAKYFGVHTNQIYKIKSRENWKHI